MEHNQDILGLRYRPFDNSYCVNLTSATSFLNGNKSDISEYPGGTFNDLPKVCTIVSHPFIQSVITAANEVKRYEMILVEYCNSTYSVLFKQDRIIRSDEQLGEILQKESDKIGGRQKMRDLD